MRPLHRNELSMQTASSQSNSDEIHLGFPGKKKRLGYINNEIQCVIVNTTFGFTVERDGREQGVELESQDGVVGKQT